MDAKKLNMIMTVTKFALVAIGVLACLLIIGGPNMDATQEVRENFRDGGKMGLAIGYTIFIIIAAAAIVLMFFVLGLISNTKRTVMSIIGVIGALLVFLIMWAMGSGDTNESLQLRETVQVDQGTISSVSAGLYTAIIGVVVAGLAWVLSPLMGRLRK